MKVEMFFQMCYTLSVCVWSYVCRCRMLFQILELPSRNQGIAFFLIYYSLLLFLFCFCHPSFPAFMQKFWTLKFLNQQKKVLGKQMLHSLEQNSYNTRREASCSSSHCYEILRVQFSCTYYSSESRIKFFKYCFSFLK